MCFPCIVFVETDGLMTKSAVLLLLAANFVLGLDEGKKRWADWGTAPGLTKSASVCYLIA